MCNVISSSAMFVIWNLYMFFLYYSVIHECLVIFILILLHNSDAGYEDYYQNDKDSFIKWLTSLL